MTAVTLIGRLLKGNEGVATSLVHQTESSGPTTSSQTRLSGAWIVKTSPSNEATPPDSWCRFSASQTVPFESTASELPTLAGRPSSVVYTVQVPSS